MSPAVASGLYVIVDPAACRGHDAVVVARLALEGGASAVQWRDKIREKGDQIAAARAIRDLCRRHEAAFIVNDHADLALALDADGVHLGQQDLPIDAVRRFAPAGFVIGASTNNVSEARAAEKDGASYIAVGAVFPTASKEPERTRAASPQRVGDVKASVGVPVVAIGGINESNVRKVIEAGADAVAVIGAVCAADDPRAAAEALVRAFAKG